MVRTDSLEMGPLFSKFCKISTLLLSVCTVDKSKVKISQTFGFLRIGIQTLLHTNVLNDVSAAPFSVSFSQLPAAKKPTENGAAVMSLRTLVRNSAFTVYFCIMKQTDWK